MVNVIDGSPRISSFDFEEEELQGKFNVKISNFEPFKYSITYLSLYSEFN